MARPDNSPGIGATNSTRGTGPIEQLQEPTTIPGRLSLISQRQTCAENLAEIMQNVITTLQDTVKH